MRVRLSWIALVVLSTAAVFLFNYWAPWQLTSLVAYTGLVLALAGLICAISPLRFLGICRRSTGIAVVLVGVALTVGALIWPAPLVHAGQRATRLDSLMPDYHFQERHTVKVHAPAAQAMAAVRRATSVEIPAMNTLMRLRGSILRQNVAGGDSQKPILEEMCGPKSAFLPLDQGDDEIVLGMVGRPWTGKSPKLKDAAEFVAFTQPEMVEIAVNLQADDIGNGWSSLTTETRVLGLDDAGRRTMARYWRLIIPGSGLIRRQWLDAIRKRAEAGSKTAAS